MEKEKNNNCECGVECQDKSNINDEIELKNKKIEELENQIKQLNFEYVDKLKTKMEQANLILQQKINEISEASKKEVSEIKKYALEKNVSNLIEIVNQFDRALSYETSDEKITKYKNGFKMFLTMFKNFLEEIGVSEIPIQKGYEFDSTFMECVELVKDGSLKDNQVQEIITKGYKLYDRVVQVANVKVVKN